MKTLLTLYLCFLVPSIAVGQVNKRTQQQIDALIYSFEQADYHRTIALANQLIKKAPQDYLSWTFKGRSLYQIGEGQKAIEALSKAISINPTYYQAYKHRALINSLLGDQDLAIKDIQVAIKNTPRNVELLNFRGSFFFRKGAYENAIKSYTITLKVDPNNYDALLYIAACYRTLKKYEQALEEVEKVFELGDVDFTPYEIRAFCYIETGEPEKAIADLHKIISLMDNKEQYNPELLAYTYNNLGFAQYKNGQSKLGLQNINLSIEMLPSNAYAYKNRAIVLLSLQQQEQACEDLSKARQLGYTKQYDDEVEVLLEEHCN